MIESPDVGISRKSLYDACPATSLFLRTRCTFHYYLGQKRFVAAARYSVAGRRPHSTVELTAAIAIALLVSGLIGEALRSAIGSRLVLCHLTPFSLLYA